MMVPKQQGKQWMMRVPVASWVVLVMVLSCWSAADAAQRFVDLTYTFDETTQVWPANPPFHRDSTEQGGTPERTWMRPFISHRGKRESMAFRSTA